MKKFYITMFRDGKKNPAFLVGPLATYDEAEGYIKEAKQLAYDIDPRCHFDAFGVSAVTAPPYPTGVLNNQLDVNQ